MRIKGNRTLKLLLRVDYIWLFMIGVGSASGGIEVLIEKNTGLPQDANLFIGIMALLIGVVIIIIGFFRKKEYERTINEEKL